MPWNKNMEKMRMTEREINNAEIAYHAAASGMVLLENNGVLPLEKRGKIALFGIGAVRTIRGGTGSGDPFNGGLSGGGDASVDQSSRYHIHILDAFEAGGYEVVTASELRIQADKYDVLKRQQKNQVMQTFMFPEPYLKEEEVIFAAEQSDTGIYVLSRNSGEGTDRKQKYYSEQLSVRYEIGDYLLAAQEKDNIRLLRKHFKHLIIVLNVGGIIDMKDIKEAEPDSILLMGLAGQEGGRAVRDILNGTLFPSGKLTDTWAAKYEDYPASSTFADNDGNSELEKYQEGIFVGYRYFDSFHRNPIYEFGYGIGYTNFTISIVGFERVQSKFRVRTEIENTGGYPGAEVLQLYISAYNTDVDMPAQELKGFKKTRILKPGESQIIELEISVPELEIYDESNCAYVVKKGIYLFRIGNSSRNTQPVAKVIIAKDIVTGRASEILPLIRKLEEFHHKNYVTEDNFYPELPEFKIEKFNFEDKKMDHKYLEQEVTTYTTNPSYQKVQAYESVVRMPKKHVKWKDVLAGSATLEELAAQMTDEELTALNCGTGWGVADEINPVIGENSETVPGAAGETTRLLTEKYGIPSIVLVDGPGGIRVRQEYEALNIMTGKKEKRYHYCTAWPSGTLLAQSFDPEIMKKIGIAVAVEMKEIGASILLAPGMNIHRDPLCGRNFEYYSEDPLISGMMAAAFVDGMQNSGMNVGACIKHFAANNQETNRSCVDEWIGQRALREIYLKGFEIAVRRSQPFAIMTSYNLINGVPTADSYDLCTRLARGEWGFNGLIMTDWNGGSSSASKSMHAGNDLIMPGGESKKREILLAIKQIEPEFDERGQILFTKIYEQLPFYEDHWNSFHLKEDGKDRCTVDLGEGYLADIEGELIRVEKEPIYTEAATRQEFIHSNGEVRPFKTPLTVRFAKVSPDGRKIIYNGEYDRHPTICRGDLLQCALHILKILQRIFSGNSDR